MSLILDALRKSEAERRRGHVPDLYAELPPLVRAPPARPRRWPLWFAGAAILLAAAALAWSLWVSRQPVPVEARAAPSSGTDTLPPLSDTPSPVAASTVPASVMATAGPASTPAALPAPAPSSADDVAASATPVRKIEAPAVVPSTPQAATEAEPSSPRYDGAVASAAPAPSPPATVAALPATSPAGSTVRVADLPPGEREQLPALKVSMHMWGPTPAQRFAIIDGTRVAQGDRVGEAVVEEIVADGVVLNWHGRRLSLPLR